MGTPSGPRGRDPVSEEKDAPRGSSRRRDRDALGPAPPRPSTTAGKARVRAALLTSVSVRRSGSKQWLAWRLVLSSVRASREARPGYEFARCGSHCAIPLGRAKDSPASPVSRAGVGGSRPHESKDGVPVRLGEAFEADAGLREPHAPARSGARVRPDHAAAREDAPAAGQVEVELDGLPHGDRAREVEAEASRREVEGVLGRRGSPAATQFDRQRDGQIAARLEALARTIRRAPLRFRGAVAARAPPPAPAGRSRACRGFHGASPDRARARGPRAAR